MLRFLPPALLGILALVAAAMVPRTGAAATVCVGSSAELIAALEAGENQNDPYTIRILQGAYFLTTDTYYGYLLNQPIAIEGGYTNNCAARSVDAANTTLFLGGATLDLLQDSGSPIASITLDGLTIENAGGITLEAGWYDIIQDDYGSVVISRSRLSGVTDNGYYTPLYIKTVDGVAFLENVQLDHFHESTGPGGCAVRVDLEGDAAVYANFVTADLAGPYEQDFCVRTGYSTNAYYVARFQSTILWASSGALPRIRGEKNDPNDGNDLFVAPDDSLFHGFTGEGVLAPPLNWLDTSPLWTNAGADDYSLTLASPAVNTGWHQPFGGLPDTDMHGHPRVVGSEPDRGAIESPYSDLDAFVVTNTNDSGPGSLRQALADANSIGNPGTIDFAIPGACPHMIALSSALPDIVSPVTIDGYSQPGSQRNGDPLAFDATLCIGIVPAGGSLGAALKVPSTSAGSLAVSGIGFGGFSQAIAILGGHDNVVTGNQFGGYLGATALPGNHISAISLGINAGGRLLIGGLDPADRNVIGDTTSGGLGQAIYVQGGLITNPDNCQIAGNLIGLDTDGLSNLPNDMGINVVSSGCAIVGNRIAGNFADAIWLNGASNSLVQHNVIGLAVDGSPRFGGGVGVRVAGADNAIGSNPGGDVGGANAYLENIVTAMSKGGVQVVSGTGNSVRGNAIFGNGAGGPGLDIDLGNPGPDANDPGDADGGANDMINFPVVDRISVTSPPPAPATDIPAVIHATLQPGAAGTYRIDAYDSEGCDGGRGHAEHYLGAHVVTLAPGTTTLSIAMSVTLPTLSSTRYLAMTATDAQNNTSEIGNCVALSSATYDDIFKNGFD